MTQAQAQTQTRPDLNCLSWWFPRLRDAGIAVPRTQILHAPDLRPLLAGETTVEIGEFLDRLGEAVQSLGGPPVFLRTGQGSDKHNWKDSCFVADLARLPQHVAALVEWSELAGFFGLPHDVWCVRELLDTEPILHAYNGMPVAREWRCFVQDGWNLCVHPYWPKQALIEGFPIVETQKSDAEDLSVWFTSEMELTREIPADFEALYSKLIEMSVPLLDEIEALARRAGAALSGAWSVDVLQTRRGLYVTDVAVARESYHVPECPVTEMFKRR